MATDLGIDRAALRGFIREEIDSHRISRVSQQLMERVAGPHARVYNNADQTIPSGAGGLWVAFNSERWDSSGMHDTATNPSRLTCAVPGLYLIQGNFTVSTTTPFYIETYVNRTTQIDHKHNGGSAESMGFSTEWRLAAGDYVEVQLRQFTGANRTLVFSSARSPELSMTYLRP